MCDRSAFTWLPCSYPRIGGRRRTPVKLTTGCFKEPVSPSTVRSVNQIEEIDSAAGTLGFIDVIDHGW